MKAGPNIATLAALIGDPSRANILTALMTGKALTASELAAEAGVSAQTASSHLRQLEDGGLIRLRQEGRHRYFSLADDDVARVLEALMGLAAGRGHLRTRTGPKDIALRQARVCYNHLAGEMGVRMFRAMTRQGQIVPMPDGLRLTPAGKGLMARLGIALDALPPSRAPLCRECLDWSMRESHLAGQTGRAMLQRFEALGWAKRAPGSRAITFSTSGLAAFEDLFGAPLGAIT